MGIMNKDKGLRETGYLKTQELIQWMKLACLCGELEVCAKETKNKQWKSWMSCAKGLIWKVVLERINLVDPKQVKSVERRRRHTSIKMITSDEERVPNKSDIQEHVTLAYNDILDLADLAINSCAVCEQGECVQGCHYRQVFHRCGIPVCRDEVKDGECEFHWLKAGEIEVLKPRNHNAPRYFDEDVVI